MTPQPFQIVPSLTGIHPKKYLDGALSEAPYFDAPGHRVRRDDRCFDTLSTKRKGCTQSHGIVPRPPPEHTGGGRQA